MNEHSIRAMTPAVPSPTEAMLARETSRGLEDVLDDETEYRFQLLQDDEPGQVFAIPAAAMQLLVRMLAEMGQGNAVTLTPIHAEVTTQQAADLLNVSRPYLVQLLEKGDIPFRKVGSRRRVRLQDVIAYKQASDAKRYETLNELTAYDQELGLQ
jgi:excisionase family DNA binding protein